MARPKCSYTGKTRFPSKLDCDLAIAGIRQKIVSHRKQKCRDEPTRSFKCGRCGGWHMTSMVLESLEH